MRKTLSLALAASLGLGGLAVAQDRPVDAPANAPAPTAADRRSPDAKPLALPPGVQAKDLNEQGDIRNAFEAVTEGAMSSDAFDNLVNRLVDADRDRIGKFKDTKPDMKALRDRVAFLKQKWNDKYGKEFDLDERLVFGQNGFVAIAQGEIVDTAQVAAHWPVRATHGSGDEAVSAAARQPGAPGRALDKAAEAGKVAGGDVNLNKGRDVAVARYPAGHGLPAIDASLIHENPDIWRFDLPDTMDGQKLYNNLLAHLNHLGDGSNWPADVNEAYRMVGHHVLAALYDVPAGQAK